MVTIHANCLARRPFGDFVVKKNLSSPNKALPLDIKEDTDFSRTYPQLTIECRQKLICRCMFGRRNPLT